MNRLTTALLFRSGVLPFLRRQWRADQQQTESKAEGRVLRRLDELANRLQATSALADDLDALQQEVRLLRAAALFNAQHPERRHAPDALDHDRVVAHIGRAVEAALFDARPMPHLVLSNLMPPDTYAALLDAIPPREFFSQKDEKKQNFRLSGGDVVPEWTLTAVRFLEESIIRLALVPALLRAFLPHMRDVYAASYGPTMGARVADLPHSATAGRLMLRRPGYHLDPHLDPRRVIITCLIYFAKPGEDEAFGTTLFRIDGAPKVDQQHTYYPEEHGFRCEFVKAVPFRPNTAVAFLNAGGAHGADIPKTAPKDTERYSYQFYVSPDPAALAAALGRDDQK